MHICKKAFVSGLVQGVYFRGSTQEKARELDLVGRARNLPDGRVEVYYCGSESAIAELEAWLAVGPSAARVDALETEIAEWQFYEDFMIAR